MDPMDPDFNIHLLEIACEVLAIFFTVLAILNASVSTMVVGLILAAVSYMSFLARHRLKVGQHPNIGKLIIIAIPAVGALFVGAGAILFESWLLAALSISGFIPLLSVLFLLVLPRVNP